MMPSLSIEDLCDHAEAVVIAEVTTVEALWTAEPTIETVVDLAVTRSIVGGVGQALQLRLPGGTVGEVTLAVEDTPALRTDHRYALFLTPRNGSSWTVFGGEQGAIDLQFDVQTQDDFVASLAHCLAHHAEQR